MNRSVFMLVAGMALTATARPLVAQKNPGPTGVTATAIDNSVTVSWAPGKRDVLYRVTRAQDPKSQGTDLTKPIQGTSFVDPKLTMGATYYYQVIAVFPDGSTGAAPPVAITLAPPSTMSVVTPGSMTGATLQPLGRSGATAYRNSPMATPTTVTGVTVTGTTTAKAVVSWSPVSGATSYTVTRSGPSASTPAASYPGLTTTTWTDLGPTNVGFWAGGVYQYQVTALLGNGTSVSGTASWTRPAPSCVAPPPTQAMLAALNPITPQFSAQGPYPGGGVFGWTLAYGQVVAYLVERSVQGSNAWTPAGTSCTGNPAQNLSGSGQASSYARPMQYTDNLGGVVPNTTYLYRFTALAANGEAGSGTVTWTAPTPGLLRWIAITPGAADVAFQWRYEPPLSAPPIAPNRTYTLTFGNGLIQTQNYNPGCGGLSGCTMKVTNAPKGSQSVRIMAKWVLNLTTYQGGSVLIPLGTLVADTVIVVP